MALVCIVSAQVFYRYVLNASLIWSETVSAWCMVWIVFIGAVSTIHDDGAVSLPMVVTMRAGRLRWNSVSPSISGASAGGHCSVPLSGRHAGGRSPSAVTPRRRRRNSGCRALRQVREVGLLRGPRVEARVWAPAVVKIQIPAQRGTRVADAVVSSQIDFLIFDRPP